MDMIFYLILADIECDHTRLGKPTMHPLVTLSLHVLPELTNSVPTADDVVSILEEYVERYLRAEEKLGVWEEVRKKDGKYVFRTYSLHLSARPTNVLSSCVTVIRTPESRRTLDNLR